MNELQQKLIVELTKVWTRNNETIDKKMIDWKLRQISNIVELDNGGLYIFDKPSIKTRFCFGYGQYGISTDKEYNDAYAMAKYASREKSYFIKENISYFDQFEKIFKYNDGTVYTVEHYIVNTKIYNLATDYYERRDGYPIQNKTGIMTENDRKKLLNALEIEKAKFLKRLEAYWKRYGNSKLKTWTYLVD